MDARIRVMTTDLEFWRKDPIAKAASIARDIDQLARRARAADLAVTAYILELAAAETRKELGKEASSDGE
jgi:hypothetical protein